MKVFVYEFVTDTVGTTGAELPASVAREGRAMRDALAQDLAALDGVEVLTLGPLPAHLRGCDAAAERDAFCAAARRGDATIVIAPEFDGILASRLGWAAAARAWVIGCGLELAELAADKQRTTAHLARAGVPVPAGIPLAGGDRLPRDFCYPAILKPLDGAGSLDVRLVAGPDGLPAVPPCERGWRLERFCPGLPASIALLCGPSGVFALPACRQLLAGDDDPHAPFAYRGGQLPLPAPLDARARRLADGVAAALGGFQASGLVGWLGIDLVLGEDPAGGDDFVIELNPRLTTSYLGLRRLAHGNLAAALAVARGQRASLSFAAEELQFAADGRVTMLPGEA